MNFKVTILLFQVDLSDVRRFEVLFLNVLGFKIVVKLGVFILEDQLFGRKGSFTGLKSVLLVLLSHLDDGLRVAATAQVEAIPVGGREPITRVEPVALRARIPRHHVIDIDAKDRVDQEVEEEHFDAIHENVVMELQVLRSFKVEPNAN